MTWAECQSGTGEQAVATLQCVPVVIGNVVNALILFSGVVAVFLIILSGYRYITSQGDAAKLDAARKTFMYAVAGLVIIVLAWSLVNFVGLLTGVKQITKSIGG